ncbi:MAG: mechanosensitive ion channel family protein [Sedimentisphaerales bacterium]|nr:mechanosensitive ion channel family protein [Sedimentisphaerales bacterium]
MNCIMRLLAQAAEGPAQSATEQTPAESTASGWRVFFDYEINGNELWRYATLLGIIFLTLFAGRITRFIIDRTAARMAKRPRTELMRLFLRSLAGPAAVAIFAAGVWLGRFAIHFDDETAFTMKTFVLWGKVAHAVMALAVAYFIYRLVDIIEHYLRRLTRRTDSQLDDMLVPLVRKTLRVFIAVLSLLFIADNILDMNVKTILATAGVGGLAVALAAQDTIANFFGSITIFADRPFQVGERIKIGGFDGPVEEVGFRSTRIRTLDGHLITIPNKTIANEMVENIGKRPYIKRVANITITYDTPPDKVQRAVEIIKQVLDVTPEVNTDPELTPKVFFNEFNDWSLNLLAIYWVKPADYWLFQEVNQRVNLAVMRGFEAEGIEFAFPTQTLYLKKDNPFADN